MIAAMRVPSISVVLLLSVPPLAAACFEPAQSPSSDMASMTPSPSSAPPAASRPGPRARPAIVATFPHDPGAFTQGMLFASPASPAAPAQLFESTGRYGESSLRRVDLASGRVLAKIDLAPELFGEGLALLRGELYQLTWREGRCIVYDAQTFAKKREMKYDSEGWGLATDAARGQLVMTDGTAVLRWMDPTDFHVARTLVVVDGNRPVVLLNELEWVRGEIFANIWGESRIARIDPKDGRVSGWIDLGELPEAKAAGEDNVMNGIAYDEAADRLLVTGKHWPHVYEVK
jgi:glutamine cyclotransferase